MFWPVDRKIKEYLAWAGFSGFSGFNENTWFFAWVKENKKRAMIRDCEDNAQKPFSGDIIWSFWRKHCGSYRRKISRVGQFRCLCFPFGRASGPATATATATAGGLHLVSHDSLDNLQSGGVEPCCRKNVNTALQIGLLQQQQQQQQKRQKQCRRYSLATLAGVFCARPHY